MTPRCARRDHAEICAEITPRSRRDMRRGALDGDGLHEEAVAVLALQLLEHLPRGRAPSVPRGRTSHNNTSRHHNSDAATWTGVRRVEEVWARVHHNNRDCHVDVPGGRAWWCARRGSLGTCTQSRPSRARLASRRRGHRTYAVARRDRPSHMGRWGKRGGGQYAVPCGSCAAEWLGASHLACSQNWHVSHWIMSRSFDVYTARQIGQYLPN